MGEADPGTRDLVGAMGSATIGSTSIYMGRCFQRSAAERTPSCHAISSTHRNEPRDPRDPNTIRSRNARRSKRSLVEGTRTSASDSSGRRRGTRRRARGNRARRAAARGASARATPGRGRRTRRHLRARESYRYPARTSRAARRARPPPPPRRRIGPYIRAPARPLAPPVHEERHPLPLLVHGRLARTHHRGTGPPGTSGGGFAAGAGDTSRGTAATTLAAEGAAGRRGGARASPARRPRSRRRRRGTARCRLRVRDAGPGRRSREVFVFSSRASEVSLRRRRHRRLRRGGRVGGTTRGRRAAAAFLPGPRAPRQAEAVPAPWGDRGLGAVAGGGERRGSRTCLAVGGGEGEGDGHRDAHVVVWKRRRKTTVPTDDAGAHRRASWGGPGA